MTKEPRLTSFVGVRTDIGISTWSNLSELKDTNWYAL